MNLSDIAILNIKSSDDLLMMSMDLCDIAILNIKGSDILLAELEKKRR